ncbi:hypothetical protein BD769DRAFT_1666966 [Suillus cothurnatus]|nr:hypothetical protein BD769DRAFT_1666966 [Suillus cothurnatus]
MKKRARIDKPIPEPATGKTIKNPFSTLVLKPRPKPIIRKLPSTPIDSATASTSGTNLTRPFELEDTARNLCALEWQSNGHQKEPASVFATYWNGLSNTNKGVYKCKAALQFNPPKGIAPVTTQTRSDALMDGEGGMAGAGTVIPNHNDTLRYTFNGIRYLEKSHLAKHVESRR